MARHPETAGTTMRAAAAQTAACLAIVLLFAFFYFVRYALCALLGGAVIGIALGPVVDRIARLGPSRRLASVLVFGTILCLTAAGLILVAPLAGAQLSSLVQRLPDLISEVDDRLVGSSWSVLRSIGGVFSSLLQSSATGGHEPVLALASDLLGDALRGCYVALLVLVIAAAWSDASNTGRRELARFIPARFERRVCDFIDEAEAKLGAYVRGQLIVCALSATVASIACFALGLPYALLLGLVVGACEVVPLIGPTFAGSGVLLIALFTVPKHAPWIALALLANHLVEGYLVTPRVMDRKIGVTPFAVLLSVVVFTALLGAPGGVLAIPLAAVLQILLDRFVFHEARVPAQAVRPHASGP